ncbi:HD domain-containing phosphohydrolase [Clostridiisalibacter paucivorans]|uniref:HD domain-containing phosphohydrolase n=1 Tax=Clostridiisalibacter paucivorans TaxID=408753 RepID=UPI0006880C23|nr:HD domain-containing phosphohydrolase [Clostridiisalibacter paucivorans]
MEYKLRDIIDLDEIKILLDNINIMTKVAIAIIDLKGNIIYSSHFSKMCNNFHMKESKYGEECIEDCINNSRLEKNYNGLKLLRCKYGIEMTIIPLFINDIKLGDLLLSQFFRDEKDRMKLASNSDKYGFDKDEYIKSLREIPVLTDEEYQSLLLFIDKFIKLISEKTMANIKQKEIERELLYAKTELESSVQQLTAYEEELRYNYDKLIENQKRLKESETQYKLLFSSMSQGFALHKIVTDENNTPIDYVFLDVNKTFEDITGMSKKEVLGKSILEILPKTESYWIKRYGQVAITGKGIEFEDYAIGLDKYYRVSAYSPEERKFAVLISDVTEERQMKEKLKKNLMEIVESLGSMLEKKDMYTAGHQKNVAKIACNVAVEMGLPYERVESIYISSILHDIGKICIPSEILNKPGKLNDIEFELIKMHSQSGYDIVKNIDFKWPIARIILEHHEKINGSGYPRGLKGEEILLESKIITVADVVEAIASHRPYRPALGIEYAMKEIDKNKGILFDEKVVDACLNIYKKGKIGL